MQRVSHFIFNVEVLFLIYFPGRTLVSLAAESKLVPEIIKEMKYLIEKKADCSLVDLEGYNPVG